MKNLVLLLTFLSMITLNGIAQTGFVEYKGEGKVILNDGKTVEGKVTFRLSSPGKVFVVVDGKKEKYNYNEVKEFMVDNKHYYTIQTKALGNSNTFAYILNPENTKMRIYQYEQQPSILSGGDSQITTEYYVLFEGEEFAININDAKFLPFKKKMAAKVESCSELSKKIAGKEDGYKVGMASLPGKKLEVFLKVAKEYDECK
jgi:hypothetical protein